MKLHLSGLLCAALLLSACGQSEEEKFYQQMNKDRELSEINKQRNSCIRQIGLTIRILIVIKNILVLKNKH